MSATAADSPDRIDLVFRALASKPRREILQLLATGADDDERCCSGDVCACVFAEKLGLGAPTISHHMKTLSDAGLVTSTKRGLWVYYRLVPEALGEVLGELNVLAGGGAANTALEAKEVCGPRCGCSTKETR